MRGPDYYTAEVIESLCEVYMADICKAQGGKRGQKIRTVFPGNRPSAVGDGMSEFLVIRPSRSLGDHGAYQNASIYIDMYIRNKENGMQNTLRLKELTKAVLAKFKDGPITSGEDGRWKVGRPRVVFSGDDNRGFNVQMVRCTLFVNTTDRFGGEAKE